MGRYATGVINVRHAWHATGRPPSTAQFETKSLRKSDWDQTHFSWQTQNLSLSLRKSDWDWPKASPNDLSANSNSNFEFDTKRVVGPNDLSSNFSSQTVLEMGGGL